VNVDDGKDELPPIRWYGEAPEVNMILAEMLILPRPDILLGQYACRAVVYRVNAGDVQRPRLGRPIDLAQRSDSPTSLTPSIL
jgi:hypothetical protein